MVNDPLKCPEYTTECFIILLHKRYIEIEKWAYFTVKIIIRNYFACNTILNKK